MNAAEQATSIEFASKIATVVHLFKSELPDLRVDLKPWTNDSDTRSLVDPDSVDIGLHFPGLSRLFHRSEERRVGKECRSRWSPYH